MKEHYSASRQFFVPLLLLVVLIFMLAGCGSDDKEDHIAVVKEYFQAVDKRNVSAIPVLFTEDATQEFVGNSGVIVGAEAIAKQLELALSQLDSMKTDFIAFVEENNTVFAHVKHTAVFKAGGAFKNREGITPPVVVFEESKTVAWQAMAIFKLDHGMIVDEKIVRDDVSIAIQMGPPVLN